LAQLPAQNQQGSLRKALQLNSLLGTFGLAVRPDSIEAEGLTFGLESAGLVDVLWREARSQSSLHYAHADGLAPTTTPMWTRCSATGTCA
jgi:hypothetical protein